MKAVNYFKASGNIYIYVLDSFKWQSPPWGRDHCLKHHNKDNKPSNSNNAKLKKLYFKLRQALQFLELPVGPNVKVEGCLAVMVFWMLLLLGAH